MFLSESVVTGQGHQSEESIMEAVIAFNDAFFEAFQESAIAQHEVLMKEATGVLTEAEATEEKEQGKVAKTAGKVWDSIVAFAGRVWSAIKRGIDYLMSKFREWTKWYDKHKAEVAAVKSTEKVEMTQYLSKFGASSVLKAVQQGAKNVDKLVGVNVGAKSDEQGMTGIIGYDSFADLLKAFTKDKESVTAAKLAEDGADIWNSAVECVKVANEMLKTIKELQSKAAEYQKKNNTGSSAGAQTLRRTLSMAAALANGALSAASTMRNKALTYMSKAVAVDKRGSSDAKKESFDEDLLESFKI